MLWIFLAACSNVCCETNRKKDSLEGRFAALTLIVRCFDFVYLVVLCSLGLLGLRAKRNNEFSRTCVFSRPTCITLILNKKFEATFTHDIH